jgi:multiple sugar transport system substrate-binding protein
MRRAASVAALLAALAALVASGCGGSSNDSKQKAATGDGTPASAPKAAGKVTLWVGFSERELGVVKNAVADFERSHPAIKVKVVGSISDDKIIAAIRGGNAPDVAQSFTADNTGAFCNSGGWIDLKPYMQRDHIDESMFGATSVEYTKYKDMRCALPMLADTYGLYYNKALFKQAGITSPPKTMSELTADAKKLTQKNPDGTFKVVGFDPMQGFYENAPAHYGPLFGAKWVDDQGKSALSSGGWDAFLKWSKDLIDFYGYDALTRWQAGAGDEFSPQNAFERGKMAMAIDGEWRTAFIKAEHPELDYGTAPMPVSDDHPELYGAGYVTGNILGIPKTAKNKDAAWELLKWLATDEHAEAMLSNGLRNVPTLNSALNSSELKPDPKFKPFLDIFANQHTATTPITAAGSANQELFQTFVVKWQSGKATDLQGGLADMDKQIDAQLSNAAGPQVP